MTTETGSFKISVACVADSSPIAPPSSFAMHENGNRPQTVVMVPGVFELDMKRGPDNIHKLPHTIGHQHNRRAA